jgi:two-component system, cell cycle response regulator DivK
MPTALIIDDNASNALVLKQLLQVEGVSATTLSNPAHIPDQLDLVASADLVFLDLEMPKVNGYEVLNLIRSTPGLGHTPVIAYSVYTAEIDQAQALGFDGFLGKPLNAEDFPDQLARLLRGEPVWQLP